MAKISVPTDLRERLDHIVSEAQSDPDITIGELCRRIQAAIDNDAVSAVKLLQFDEDANPNMKYSEYVRRFKH